MQIVAGDRQNEDEEGVSPQQMVEQLKMLYELHKVEVNKDMEDSMRLQVVTLKDKRANLFFKNQLYQQIAKKAIQTQEFLFQTLKQDS